MAQLRTETRRVLERIQNSSSDDPKNEILEIVEKLSNYGKRIPDEEIKNFIKSLSIIFDCSIREAIEEQKPMDNIDQICDFILKKFVLKNKKCRIRIWTNQKK